MPGCLLLPRGRRAGIAGVAAPRAVGLLRRALTAVAPARPPAPPVCGPQIATAVGPSGPNHEYLFKLADAMRAFSIQDGELFELEARRGRGRGGGRWGLAAVEGAAVESGLPALAILACSLPTLPTLSPAPASMATWQAQVRARMALLESRGAATAAAAPSKRPASSGSLVAADEEARSEATHVSLS